MEEKLDKAWQEGVMDVKGIMPVMLSALCRENGQGD
jgi:hypothetical protein